ncbi:MAG: hypothetical protein Q8S84_00155 [bacterium]|nr:hypothetical protein [bacterium]MDP3380003.1 hypothetical protein [bacterium]
MITILSNFHRLIIFDHGTHTTNQTLVQIYDEPKLYSYAHKCSSLFNVLFIQLLNVAIVEIGLVILFHTLLTVFDISE